MRGGSGNQEDETRAQTILNLDDQIPDFGSKSFMNIFKNEDLAKDFLEKIMDINFPNKEATISELEVGLETGDLNKLGVNTDQLNHDKTREILLNYKKNKLLTTPHQKSDILNKLKKKYDIEHINFDYQDDEYDMDGDTGDGHFFKIRMNYFEGWNSESFLRKGLYWVLFGFLEIILCLHHITSSNKSDLSWYWPMMGVSCSFIAIIIIAYIYFNFYTNGIYTDDFNSLWIMTVFWFFIIIPIILCYIEIKQKNTQIDKDTNNTRADRKNKHIGVLGYNANNFVTTLVFTFVFGFLDNAGLKLGLGGLDRMLKRKEKEQEDHELKFLGNPNFREGIGNTYSDGIGAIAGTVIAIAVNTAYPTDESPDSIWADLIGTIVGCVIGILFPDWLLNNSSSLNETTARKYKEDYLKADKKTKNIILKESLSLIHYLITENKLKEKQTD